MESGALPAGVGDTDRGTTPPAAQSDEAAVPARDSALLPAGADATQDAQVTREAREGTAPAAPTGAVARPATGAGVRPTSASGAGPRIRVPQPRITVPQVSAMAAGQVVQISPARVTHVDHLPLPAAVGHGRLLAPPSSYSSGAGGGADVAVVIRGGGESFGLHEQVPVAAMVGTESFASGARTPGGRSHSSLVAMGPPSRDGGAMYTYDEKKRPRRRVPYAQWSDSLFDCHSDVKICLCSFLLPPWRWAKTAENARVMGFCPALMVMSLPFLIIAALLLADFSILDEFTSLVLDMAVMFFAATVSMLGFYCRRVLRDKYGMEDADRCKDFLSWALCFPCAIAQEARHVDRSSNLIPPGRTGTATTTLVDAYPFGLVDYTLSSMALASARSHGAAAAASAASAASNSASGVRGGRAVPLPAVPAAAGRRPAENVV